MCNTVTIDLSPLKALKGSFRVGLGGSFYSLRDSNLVGKLVEAMLDHATGYYLVNSYNSFIDVILADYPQLGVEPGDYFDETLLATYVEVFNEPSFEAATSKLSKLSCYEKATDWSNPQATELLKYMYEWGVAHANQFKEASRAIFTKWITACPLAPHVAFGLACLEIGLNLDNWADYDPDGLFDVCYYELPQGGSTRPESEAAL